MQLDRLFLRRALTLASLALSFSAIAQQVSFRNTENFETVADRLVRDVTGDPLVGTHYFAQLYYGSQGAPQDSLAPVMFPPANFRDPGTSLPGTWQNGGLRTLTGFNIGDTVTLQVRAWDATGGLSYDQAQALGRNWGQSATFTYQIPGQGPVFAWYMDNFRSFALVPEPSTIALAVVGAGALLFLKRRK